MNDVEKLLKELKALGERTPRGPFHCLTITADGRCRASWMNHAEEFRVEELAGVLTADNAEVRGLETKEEK